MARSHAKVLVQVWRDPDWKALSMPAQWLYWVLLSQPKLTLVGSLEITPGRWAQYANGLTRAMVDEAFHELRENRVVLVDDETDELLVRTFTTHDLDPNRINVNLTKGLWGQWASIESDKLRRQAIRGMPEDVWAKLEPHAPDDAVHIRRSARFEPETESQSQPAAPPRFEPPPSSHLPTETGHRPAEDPRSHGSVDNLHPLAARAATATERLRAGHPSLNPNPATGADAVVVQFGGPRSNGEAS